MSALPPKADMCGAARDVRFGPIAETASDHHGQNQKGPLGMSAAAIPSAIRRRCGGHRFGSSASHASNSDPMDRFGCAINHNSSSNTTFCDAQHTALSGVSVLMVGTMALTVMMPCYEGPSDSSGRAQAIASRDWIHSRMDGGHTRDSNLYRVSYSIRSSKH